MLKKHTTLYSSTPNLTSLAVNKEFENRRHSISDFSGRSTSQLPVSIYCRSSYFDHKNKCDVSTAIDQGVSNQAIPQMAEIPREPSSFTSRSISRLEITDTTSVKEKNNEVASSSEWNSGMPLTPVRSTSLDYIEGNDLPVREFTRPVESIPPITRSSIIPAKSKRLFLWDKINRFINDLVERGIFGVDRSADQKHESGTLYDFVATSLKSRINPVDSLCDRIKVELDSLLSLVEDNNCDSINEVIDWLNAGVSFHEIISFIATNNDSFIATNNEMLGFLRPVISGNIRQAINNNESNVALGDFRKLEELLLIYCLTVGRITINTDLCEDINISLQNQVSPSKPVWRTSFSQVIDKMLSPTAMLMLHIVYWAMTIAHSTKERYVSNNFPNENILGTIMAVYCSIAITHGSLMNSIRIYRSGKSNPDGSKALMWSSIFLNTLKDATSLGGSVLSLINIPAYIPIFQAGNIMFSTLFAEALVYRAKEANRGDFDSKKLKLFLPLILLPGFLLGTSSIALPYCIPSICERLFGYSGGDTRFLMHSLKSVVSNLLTTSSEGLKEANRILILASVYTSLSVTTWMFVDINRCEHRKLKKELQSFKGYLVFRYLVTVFTALFSMADPYAPSNKIVERATTEPLKLGSGTTKTIESTIASSFSTGYMTTEIIEKVGALYVFLSTCDTGKGIIWEPNVGNFNRKAIKSVLRDSQLCDLHKQFKDTVRNRLRGVESARYCLEVVVKTLEEIGFSDKLKKIRATDFEPDWLGVFDTVRSLLILIKKPKQKPEHTKDLNLKKVFENNSEEDIPLLIRGGSSVKSVDRPDKVLTNNQNNSLEQEQEDETPFFQKTSDSSDKLVRKLPQGVSNGRFTVITINSNQLSSSIEDYNTTTQKLSPCDSEKASLLSCVGETNSLSLKNLRSEFYESHRGSMPEVHRLAEEHDTQNFENSSSSSFRRARSVGNIGEHVIDIPDQDSLQISIPGRLNQI